VTVAAGAHSNYGSDCLNPIESVLLSTLMVG